MSKDLAYYRQLPYEREWLMREEAGQKYFVVRLKDLPAVAGDGISRDEAVDDLREAFDELVSAWLESGRPVPEPSRAFTVSTSLAQAPLKEWPTPVSEPESTRDATGNWADSAVAYSTNVLVESVASEPRLATDLHTAVVG